MPLLLRPLQRALKLFIDITSGANMINVNEIFFCIKPENDPQLSHSYSVVPGPPQEIGKRKVQARQTAG